MRYPSIFIATLPALLFACGGSSTTTDAANDAAGTGSPFLAREVVGVHMLSTDINYDEPCNYLAEEFVTETFGLEGVTLEKFDKPNGCEFVWGTNKVSLMLGDKRPFPSIYHAEYVFDRLYQPKAVALTTGQTGAGDTRAPLSGPAPEGTGAELPATNLNSAKRDTSAANDTASTVSGRPARAAQFTEPGRSMAGFKAVPDVGDKAVWEPAKQTLHVLLNNHILNIQVKTTGSDILKQQRAATLAQVILSHLVDNYHGTRAH